MTYGYIYGGTHYPYPGPTTEPRDRLRFGQSRPQVYKDSWRGTERVCRFYGVCVCCGKRTYAFDDGENDPRGALGDHAACPLELAEHLDDEGAAEVRRVGGVTFPACFKCMNDHDRYKFLIDRATRAARKMGADI